MLAVEGSFALIRMTAGRRRASEWDFGGCCGLTIDGLFCIFSLY